MAFKAHRAVTGLAWGCALLLGLGLNSCASPQFTYIGDSGNNTYFKVPYGWQQVNHSDLCTEMKSGGTDTCSSAWMIAYEDGNPSARDFGSSILTRPFVMAEVQPYTSQTGTPLTDETLQDLYFPVTAGARQAFQIENGQQLPGFKLLRSLMLNLTGGVHGIRETYNYQTAPGATNTFDQVALANAAGTIVYSILVHCRSTCYSQDKIAINDIMSSFTVRSP